MRPVLCGLAAASVVFHASFAAAQQGRVLVSAASQSVVGSPERVAGEHAIDPDFGVSWIQPGVRFGSFEAEIRGARRGDRMHVGRNYAALRDLRTGGFRWTFEAGDGYLNRGINQYGFSNFSTPALTFNGGAATLASRRSTVNVIAGKATAWRNIFGSDPDTLEQTLGLVRASYQATSRLDLFTRVSRFRTSDLREFSFTIADSDQVAGGARFQLTPAVHLIGDAAFLRYRRVDSNTQVPDGSFLAGTNVLLPRGWIQFNVARFSPGDFPAMNDPLHDREAAFLATEYDVWSSVRLFGGVDAIKTNVDPDLRLPPSRDLPRSAGTRVFGGIQFRLGGPSMLTIRIEEGDRVTKPVRLGRVTESDTGVRSAEWQSLVGRYTAYGRYARRQHVDNSGFASTYTQDDVAGQVFVRLTQELQLFGNGGMTRYITTRGEGSTYVQMGGGGQFQLPAKNIWVRGEATLSRNVDLLTRDFVPRRSFNVGLNGQLAQDTTFNVSIAADRMPLLFGVGSPWTTRSVFQVTRAFSTGAARVTPVSPGFAAAARDRGTGTIVGRAYADWNGNSTQDPDEEPLENIPIKITGVGSVTTRRDGEYAFLDVPTGPQQVGLDTAAVPIDFDPPAISAMDIELDRNSTRRVSFGLIPLGSVRGRVIRDANGNGRADAGEEPINGAILVLDRGSRSEEVRRGVYRFDSIRSGDHVVSLVHESLPEGAVITSAVEVPVALMRNQLTADIDFLVTVEKRPETRKVFPSKSGVAPSPSAAATGTPPAVPPRTPARPSSSAAPPAAAAAGRPPVPPAANAVRTPPAPTDGSRYAVQVAALNDPLRARVMAETLAARGFPAYVLPPGQSDPDGPYRVRVGRYRTREAASGAAATLQKLRREKLWVINEPPTQ
jgi:cell division septation protein DedD